MAGRVIKQGSFLCMLMLSVVVVYAVTIAGVHAGRLKKDISWTHPIFVALFNREYASNYGIDAGNTAGTQATETAGQTKEAEIKITCDKSTEMAGYENDSRGRIEEMLYEDTDSCHTAEAAEKNGLSAENVTSEDDNESYAGKVEYAVRDMRYARSGYYHDSDIIALSSELDYVQVDNDYFSDACFIGDSRIEGLYFYGGLKEADYYYKPGTTVYDMLDEKLSYNGSAAPSCDVTDALAGKQYGKIYIMVGVNELGDKTPEDYAAAYADNIERIRRLQPEASIFILGMMHVTTQYSAASDVFNNDNIDNRNTAAAGLADGKKIFYLDMNECVDDGNGGVRSEYSKDGVHLKAEYYKLWTEWMKAHGVNNLTK